VQVDPIKPTLKAPVDTRLKLIYEELLSKFGFKFNLHRYTMARVKADAHAETEATAGGNMNSISEHTEAGAGVGTEAAVAEAWAGAGAGARVAPEAPGLPAWGVSSSARTRKVVSARAAGARRPAGANTSSASGRGARTRPATANDENIRTGPAAGSGAAPPVKSAAMLDYERAKAVASAPSSETFSLLQMPRRVASARGALAPLPTVSEGNARGARSRTRPATANDENKRTGLAAAAGAPMKPAAILDYERAKAGRCSLTLWDPH